MGEERHRRKVRCYYLVRQLQGEGKNFSQICEMTGLKSNMVYNYSKLHISKFLTHDQIKAMDAAREMSRIISGGIITKDIIFTSLGADSLPDLSIDVRIPSVEDMRRSGRLSGSSGKG